LEQRVLVGCAAFLAVRMGSGDSFGKNVLFLAIAFVAYLTRYVLLFETRTAAEVCFVVMCGLTLATSIFRSTADLLVLAFAFGALSRPAPDSLDGEALRGAFVAARDAKADKASSFWDRLVQRAQATFDDLLASLASHAADVVFADLHVAVLARVSLPTQSVLLLGAFHRWINLSLHLPSLATFLETNAHCWKRPRDASASAAATTGNKKSSQGLRTVLLRIPVDARPGQELSVIVPSGRKVDFVVPPGALPGSLIMIALPF